MIVGSSAGIEAGLVLRRANPLNCETPISALMGGMVMPNERFYPGSGRRPRLPEFKLMHF